MHLSLQRLQHSASTDAAAKDFLTQQHIQGPRLYQFLDAWHADFQQTVCASRVTVLQLLGAVPSPRTPLTIECQTRMPATQETTADHVGYRR